MAGPAEPRLDPRHQVSPLFASCTPRARHGATSYLHFRPVLGRNPRRPALSLAQSAVDSPRSGLRPRPRLSRRIPPPLLLPTALRRPRHRLRCGAAPRPSRPIRLRARRLGIDLARIDTDPPPTHAGCRGPVPRSRSGALARPLRPLASRLRHSAARRRRPRSRNPPSPRHIPQLPDRPSRGPCPRGPHRRGGAAGLARPAAGLRAPRRPQAGPAQRGSQSARRPRPSPVADDHRRHPGKAALLRRSLGASRGGERLGRQHGAGVPGHPLAWPGRGHAPGTPPPYNACDAGRIQRLQAHPPCSGLEHPVHRPLQRHHLHLFRLLHGRPPQQHLHEQLHRGPRAGPRVPRRQAAQLLRRPTSLHRPPSPSRNVRARANPRGDGPARPSPTGREVVPACTIRRMGGPAPHDWQRQGSGPRTHEGRRRGRPRLRPHRRRERRPRSRPARKSRWPHHLVLDTLQADSPPSPGHSARPRRLPRSHVRARSFGSRRRARPSHVGAGHRQALARHLRRPCHNGS
mmetsp:Transcript_16821/g.63799  ORF Transcript_16821/g.63799 Transcript_16821/m.63799 type:complete len:517 (+) Transcript_16821:1081-2631(+)